MNIMITGCGKHSKEIVESLKQNEDNLPVRVIGVNSDPTKAMTKRTDAFHIVSPVGSPRYLKSMLNVCDKENIDIVIPYITSELETIAGYRKEFRRHGAMVSVSSPESLKILNDKKAMHDKWPELMPDEMEVTGAESAREALNRMKELHGNNLCCKITGKCGGTGFCIIDNEKAYDIGLFNKAGAARYISEDDLVKIADRYSDEILLQERIPGIDYSVVVLADKGKIVAMVGYAGYQMEFGAVTSGRIEKNQRAYSIVEKITAESKLDGNACFDFIIPQDSSRDPVLLECNPRINASIGFARAAGADMIWMRCKQLMGIPVSFDPEKIRLGLRMVKYYESEYYV